MGMLDRFNRLISPSLPGVDALREAYVDADVRVRLLQRHAEVAPQEYSAAALRSLAVRANEVLEKLRDALRAADTAVPTAAKALGEDALNHWGRIVQDLELQQAAVQKFHDWAVQFTDDAPALTALFRELKRNCEDQRRELRMLIARADPQALD